MKRRDFIALVGATAAWPIAVCAQARTVYRVGLINSVGPDFWEPDLSNPSRGAFYYGLRDLGYVEGQNLVLKRRSAEGKGNKRSAEIGTELIRDGIDIIVVDRGAMAKEMMGVTNTVPILVVAGLDLVAQGVVSSLARPGGNVTGFSMQAGPEYETKRLQMLKDAVPKLSRVAFLGVRGQWDDTNGKALRVAAETLGVTLFFAEHNRTNYADAFALMARERPDGLIVAINPESGTRRSSIIEFAFQHRIPAMYWSRRFVVDGGLLSYGVDFSDLSRRAAGYVDKILRGTKPRDLPVEQPTKFELFVNLKTARAIGLEMPMMLRALANEVIE